MNPDHHDWLTQGRRGGRGRAGFLSCVKEYVVNCRWARCIEGQEVATSTWRSVVNGVCSPSAESSYCRRTTLSERTVNQWSLAQRVILVVLGSEVTSPERQRQTTACRKQCSGSSRQGWWWSGGGGDQRNMEGWVGRWTLYSAFMCQLQQRRRIERNREIIGLISTTSTNE